MAITFLQQRKAQRNLILFFIGIILVTAIIIWQGFFKEEEVISPQDFIKLTKEIKIDFKALENPIFQKLQLFIEEEVGENIGRENPFIPY